MIITRHPIASRQQWLAMRQEDVTASDIGALFNVSPYKSELKLYAEKAGLPGATSMTNIMQRGLWLEPGVIRACQDLHPDWQIEQLAVYLRCPELKLGATPDAVATIDGSPVNCQLKVVAAPEFNKHWENGPPLHIVLQAITEAMLLDVPSSVVACLILDAYSAELMTYEIPRHVEAEGRILGRVHKFHQNLARGMRPAARTAEDGQLLARIFPDAVPEPVLDLSGDNQLPELLDQRALMKAVAKEAKDEIEAIDARIKDKLGAAERATLPGWKIAWPTITVAEHLQPATSFRRLTVSKRKDDR